MNQASRTAPSPSPVTDSTPSGETRAGQGDGRGKRAAAAANSGACADGAGVPAGRSSRKVPSSGTQIFSHTSQVACSSTGPAPSQCVVISGSSTSPS